MTDRRASLRLKKHLECAIYTGGNEYKATIIDISENGIAFETDMDADIGLLDTVYITMSDNYLDVCRDEHEYTHTVSGYIKNITATSDGHKRCGCYINDLSYNRYVQEQYIAHACGR